MDFVRDAYAANSNEKAAQEHRPATAHAEGSLHLTTLVRTLSLRRKTNSVTQNGC